MPAQAASVSTDTSNIEQLCKYMFGWSCIFAMHVIPINQLREQRGITQRVTPVQHPGAVHENALTVVARSKHAARQKLTPAAAHVHDAARFGPVKGILQGNLPALQAKLCEIGHCLLEVVRKCLVARLFVVLRQGTLSLLQVYLIPLHLNASKLLTLLSRVLLLQDPLLIEPQCPNASCLSVRMSNNNMS